MSKFRVKRLDAEDEATRSYSLKFIADGGALNKHLRQNDVWQVDRTYVGARRLTESKQINVCDWGAAYVKRKQNQKNGAVRVYVSSEKRESSEDESAYKDAGGESNLLNAHTSHFEEAQVEDRPLGASNAWDYHVLQSRHCATVCEAYRDWMDVCALQTASDSGLETEDVGVQNTAAHTAVDDAEEYVATWKNYFVSAGAAAEEEFQREQSELEDPVPKPQGFTRERKQPKPAQGRGPWLLLRPEQIKLAARQFRSVCNCDCTLDSEIPDVQDEGERFAVCLRDAYDSVEGVEGDIDLAAVERAWMSVCRIFSEWLVLAAYRIHQEYSVPNAKLLRDAVGPCRSAVRGNTRVWLDPQQSLDTRLTPTELPDKASCRHFSDAVATASGLARCGRYEPGATLQFEFVCPPPASVAVSLLRWFQHENYREPSVYLTADLLVGELLRLLLNQTVFHCCLTAEDVFTISDTRPDGLSGNVELTLHVGGIGVMPHRKKVAARVLDSFDYWTACLRKANLEHISDKLMQHAEEDAGLHFACTASMWPWLQSLETVEDLREILGAPHIDLPDPEHAKTLFSEIGEMMKYSEQAAAHKAAWSYLPLLLEVSLAAECREISTADQSNFCCYRLCQELYGLTLAEYPREERAAARAVLLMGCLLYTSDAADE